MPELDDEPVMYPAVEYLWCWFMQLHGRRGGGFGPAPLTYGEIQAWAALTRTAVAPWEIEMLVMLDDEFMRFQAERAEKDKPAGK